MMRIPYDIFMVFRRFASLNRHPRIAVVGSGPAGLYVCSGLLRRLSECQIDVFDGNPVPYGLIRYGIAPDHSEMKNCINQFDRMFSQNIDRLSLYCNVTIGKDLTFDELCIDYDAVVLAYGARRQRKLQIPGIDAVNVFSGGDFVSWYNGMAGAKEPLLDCKMAVIVGNGNVALDCSRIILSSKNDRLFQTDMPISVLNCLSNSNISEVVILGRRGLTDVSFTIKELREQTRILDCDFSAELSPNEREKVEQAIESFERPKKRITDLLLKHCKNIDVNFPRYCRLLFQRTPVKVDTEDDGRVNALCVKNMINDQIETLKCGLLIYSIGYQNVVLDGVPKNQNGELKMLDTHRVHVDCGALVYATGWCAHQPRGVIVNTQMDASNTAERLCEDIKSSEMRNHTANGSLGRLQSRGVQLVTWNDWKRIDQMECELGALHGKKREKIVNIDELLQAKHDSN